MAMSVRRLTGHALRLDDWRRLPYSPRSLLIEPIKGATPIGLVVVACVPLVRVSYPIPLHSVLILRHPLYIYTVQDLQKTVTQFQSISQLALMRISNRQRS
ncbi:hypothetical protein BDV11DRAFT_35824 [Aspergillus similis]